MCVMFVRVIYSVSTGVCCDTNAALLWASFLVASGPTSYATGTWMWWFRFCFSIVMLWWCSILVPAFFNDAMRELFLCYFLLCDDDDDDEIDE